VLVGTGSVAESEALSRCLSAAGAAHQLLHARQDAQEAAVVAAAGRAGCITVATSMAGRGTDIGLDARALAAGGLHVLLCQANASRRVDRQFLGRAGRQGQPGSTDHWVALDMVLFQRCWPTALLRLWQWALRLGLLRMSLGSRALLAATQGLESYAQAQQRVTLCRRAEAEERELSFARDLSP
jgi:preprotein translocase subunit SecA